MVFLWFCGLEQWFFPGARDSAQAGLQIILEGASEHVALQVPKKAAGRYESSAWSLRVSRADKKISVTTCVYIYIYVWLYKYELLYISLTI